MGKRKVGEGMNVYVKQLTDDIIVEELAGVTIGKDLKPKSGEWHRRMMLSEHSPIRGVILQVVMEGIPKHVSVHLVRHGHCQHMVKSSRPDWTGQPRSEEQLVNHTIIGNPQTLINISRKRLCTNAEQQTRSTWQAVVDSCAPELRSVCVPECIYRGFCPEMKPCGYADTEHYSTALKRYRMGE